MSKYLGSLVVVLFGVACGGTTDTEGGGGGTSQGGSDAGHDSGGSGGANRAGSNTGGYNTGGAPVGGAGTYDPRCPAHQPMGACNADNTVLSCQYDPTRCLCYETAPGSFAYCQRVDPNCMYVPPGTAGAAGTTGTGGTGGTAAAASGSDPGAGGFSAKVALPPKLVCTCSAGMWACIQGLL